MANHALLSVVQLWNYGYSVTLMIDGVTIIDKKGKAILKGQHDTGTGFW
jgi:hypothetical protein